MGKHWLLIVFSFLFSISSLKAEYFTITRFSVNVTITEEGYADFDEVIEVEFFVEPYSSTINKVFFLINLSNFLVGLFR